jgi:hypothetical protein
MAAEFHCGDLMFIDDYSSNDKKGFKLIEVEESMLKYLSAGGR